LVWRVRMHCNRELRKARARTTIWHEGENSTKKRPPAIRTRQPPTAFHTLTSFFLELRRPPSLTLAPLCDLLFRCVWPGNQVVVRT
jgi:hypothetical protein